MSENGVLLGYKGIGNWLTEKCPGEPITRQTIRNWIRDFGLPIHRMGDKFNSRVFALTDEIEDWLREFPYVVVE